MEDTENKKGTLSINMDNILKESKEILDRKIIFKLQ